MLCIAQPLPFQLIKDILVQACAGLAHLHGNGVVHRDFRADNLLVASEKPLRIVVADFGLSHQMQDGVTVDQTGTTIGPIRTCGVAFARGMRSAINLSLNLISGMWMQHGGPQKRSRFLPPAKLCLPRLTFTW